VPSPQGSVPALCTASATVFSIGIIFLGYWGLQEPGPWRLVDKLIATFAVIGFAFLGLVPWMATGPVIPETSDAKVRIARSMFLIGVICVWLAIVISVLF
jgi:hypothetical protein